MHQSTEEENDAIASGKIYPKKQAVERRDGGKEVRFWNATEVGGPKWLYLAVYIYVSCCHVL